MPDTIIVITPILKLHPFHFDEPEKFKSKNNYKIYQIFGNLPILPNPKFKNNYKYKYFVHVVESTRQEGNLFLFISNCILDFLLKIGYVIYNHSPYNIYVNTKIIVD